ncbi:PBP1 and LysM peptidoglycan-binding domain-containing protein [Polaribacter tangerinus]|uniref:PBP1 and LysM peptidoglycan-binding domain-containing protein n=1 Tax=Polaribacter tangerinus TaxID=1920034 RepID=UPI001E2EB929|nr:LysM peptidoglycan-binding domain-containing protein [Polaribacter tangerinus]
MKNLKLFVFLCILTFTVSCGQQNKYIEYKVKEGETMRGIAKRLHMKTKDLLRLNPDITKKPSANTVIIIPRKKSQKGFKISPKAKKDSLVKQRETVQSLDTTNIDLISDKELQKKAYIAELEKEFKVHEVKKGDTFIGLTRYYNVSKEAIIALNPILKDGLKLGQIIKILPIEEVYEEEELLYKDTIAENISLKVAFMLPFRAKELDTLTETEIFSNSKLANIVTDLYLGAEIAIDSLRNQGVSVAVELYDTESNSTNIKNIVSNYDLNSNHVIFGPLYSEEVDFIADKVKVPIVFPVFSKKQTQFTDSKVVKTYPNKLLFRAKLLNYISENFQDGNIVVVTDNTSESNFNASQISAVLEQNDSIFKVSTIVSNDGYIKKEKFTDVLQPNMNNFVVLTTNDAVIVASTINSLISLPEEVKARVFSFDKLNTYNKIDNKKLAQLQFTYVSNDYLREDSFYAKDFDATYKRVNGALPSYYATKGFDITYDILIRLASGKKLKNTFKEGFSYRIESKFDYTDQSFKVPENKGLFILKYNEDLTLTRLE